MIPDLDVIHTSGFPEKFPLGMMTAWYCASLIRSNWGYDAIAIGETTDKTFGLVRMKYTHLMSLRPKGPLQSSAPEFLLS